MSERLEWPVDSTLISCFFSKRVKGTVTHLMYERDAKKLYGLRGSTYLKNIPTCPLPGQKLENGVGVHRCFFSRSRRVLQRKMAANVGDRKKWENRRRESVYCSFTNDIILYSRSSTSLSLFMCHQKYLLLL